jgi:hypothetical protein
MSRSGYSEGCDGWALIRWRGAVASAIKGQRGQAFLREALAALDAMPDKKLTTDSLHEPATGEFCTLGVVGAARGLDLAALEYSERDGIAKAFGISLALASEIMFENDDQDDWCGPSTTPEKRWVSMRKWISGKIQTGDKS